MVMQLTNIDLLTLAEVAEQAARAAGKIISEATQQPIHVEYKASGEHLASQVVTEVDRNCEALIRTTLQSSIERYDLAVLGEETEDDGLRLIKDYFWCIDPLDGTLAFTESKPGYAVSIALVSRVGEPLIGVVFDPVTATLYSAVKGNGTFRNGTKLALRSADKNEKLLVPIDRGLAKQHEYTRFIDMLADWAERHGYEGVEFIHDAGAVINACKLLESASGCYFKLPRESLGGGSLWDFAATTCLYNEIGAHVSDYQSNKLNLNHAQTTFMNHCGVFFATDTILMKAVKGLCDSAFFSDID